MVYIIIKQTGRDLRERAAREKPREFHSGAISGYARDVEEAAQLWRDERGRDNRNFAPMLCDDGGKADAELRARTVRAAGKTWEEYQEANHGK